MKSLHAALFAATLAVVGLLAATKICDPDTMQYLASGRYTLEHGLEQGCVFTYAGDTCQVVYPQWLFHVFACAVHRIGGWNALVSLQIVIAVGVFAVALSRNRRRSAHSLAIVPLALLAAMVARERFMLRADLFALLPAVLLYVVLERYWDDATEQASWRRMLPVLAGIQAVWANTHGSFYVGFVILGAFLVESLVTRKPGIRPAVEASATIVLASLLNPFGLKSFLQPLRFMLGGARTAPQLEFLSPFAPADLTHLTVTAYKILLVVAAAVIVLAVRSLKVRDVVILAALAYLSVRGIRYIALFAVFCALLLPTYAEGLRAWIARRTANKQRSDRPTVALAIPTSVLVLTVMAGIGYAAATDRIYRFDALPRRTGWGLSDLVYPIAAADFVESAGLPGPMFNDYSIGTYLNWRLFPARKTFIDGHTYTPERLAYYFQVMAGAVPYRQVVDRYGVNVFVLNHKASETRELIVKLYRDDDWALVYFDEVAVVFLKRAPGNDELIAKYRVDPVAVERSGPAPLLNVREPADFYLGRTDRGLALSALGLDAEASVELEEAAKQNPESFVTWTALALVRENRGDAAGALAACERSVRIRPGYAQGRFWLGIMDLRRKRIDEGIAELEAAIRINPRLPLAHYNLGAAYENRGDKRRARAEYLEELAIDPSFEPARNRVKKLG